MSSRPPQPAKRLAGLLFLGFLVAATRRRRPRHAVEHLNPHGPRPLLAPSLRIEVETIDNVITRSTAEAVATAAVDRLRHELDTELRS